ncbi:MAG TPA: tyrosine-type recombinase/integrase [Hyphomicrobiaceae bacterium]
MDDHKSLIPSAGQLAPSSPISRSGITIVAATRASSDRELLGSWIDGLTSKHSKANFRLTVERFLHALDMPLRKATVEDVREALDSIAITVDSHGQERPLAQSSVRQQVLRVKSFLSYGQRLGYLQFNAGASIKAPPKAETLSKRILNEDQIGDIVHAAIADRDYLIAAVAYTSGARVSELAGLNADDVLIVDGAAQVGMVKRVQIHLRGKGGKTRDVLLPIEVGDALLEHIRDKQPGAPVFCSSRKGRTHQRLSVRGINHLAKRLAKDATITGRFSPHWWRHAHATHAIENNEPLHVVSATLGHASVAVTSVYLHVRPGRSSGDALNRNIWKRRKPEPDEQR